MPMSYEKSFSVLGELTQEIVELQTAMGIAILNRVVSETPVDTGRAKGNWQVTLNGPTDTEIDLLDKTGSTAIRAGESAIQTLNTFGRVYIQNNLPYIQALNDGYSDKAPAKYVDFAVDAVIAQAAKL